MDSKRGTLTTEAYINYINMLTPDEAIRTRILLGEVLLRLDQIEDKITTHRGISSKGGSSTLQKHGATHFKDIANKRWAKEKIK